MSIPASGLMPAHDGILRKTLRANAGFSLLTGLPMLLAAPFLAELMGLPSPIVLRFIGAGLLIFTASLFQLSQPVNIDRRQALAVVIMDGLWVLGSILLLLTGVVPLTVTGQWLVGLIAAVVTLFALLQYLGLRQIP